MITKKVLLYFPECETEKPIVYRLVKDYNLMINIFRAKVTPEEEGFLLLDITGSEEDYQKGIAFLKTFEVDINETEKGVRWDVDRCTQCGSCIPHCPTNALYISDRRHMSVMFDSNQCIECLSCIRHCPFNACSSLF